MFFLLHLLPFHTLDLPWVLQNLTSLQSSRQVLKHEVLLLDYVPDFEMFF